MNSKETQQACANITKARLSSTFRKLRNIFEKYGNQMRGIWQSIMDSKITINRITEGGDCTENVTKDYAKVD